MVGLLIAKEAYSATTSAGAAARSSVVTFRLLTRDNSLVNVSRAAMPPWVQQTYLARSTWFTRSYCPFTWKRDASIGPPSFLGVLRLRSGATHRVIFTKIGNLACGWPKNWQIGVHTQLPDGPRNVTGLWCMDLRCAMNSSPIP